MRRRVTLFYLLTALIFLCGGPTIAVAGEMIISDGNNGLAVHAWSGAQHGSELRLNNGCRTNNPECTWHWNSGMIVNDHNPGLSIHALNGAQQGSQLRLHNACQKNNPDCTWHWGDLTK
jgi:hypothetical protein